MGDIFVGCAGYNYAGWKGDKLFYPRLLKDADQLKHYAGVFPSCEINATFHGMQSEETLGKWISSVRPGFVFVLKARQDMTHMHKLQNIDDQWRYFYDRAHSCLASQLGPILFQLPPTFKRDDARIEYLGSLLPGGCQVAVEFRHSSWLVPEVYAIMRKYNMAVVENITPDNSFPHTDEITASFTYTRMHKALESESTNIATWYSEAQLQKIADRAVARGAAGGVTQFIFFLNDIDAAGPKNGQTLMEMITKARGKEVPLVKAWKAAKPAAKSMQSFFGKAVKKEEAKEDEEEKKKNEEEEGTKAEDRGDTSERAGDSEGGYEGVSSTTTTPTSSQRSTSVGAGAGADGAAAKVKSEVISIDDGEGEDASAPVAKKAKEEEEEKERPSSSSPKSAGKSTAAGSKAAPAKKSPKKGTLLSFFGKK